MNANGDEALHEIIEDGICDICEGPAIPYDSYWDIPYCAEHAMEFLTDIALEDYVEADPSFEQHCIMSRLTYRPVVDATDCIDCADPLAGTSRVSPPDYTHATFGACALHGAERLMSADLLTRDDWVLDITEAFEEDF